MQYLSLCIQSDFKMKGAKALEKAVLSFIESILEKYSKTLSKSKAELCLSTSVGNSSGLEARSPGAAKCPQPQHRTPTHFLLTRKQRALPPPSSTLLHPKAG